MAKQMLQSVSPGRHSILVEQERKRNRMLLQILHRIPYAAAFLGGNVGCRAQILLSRLELSHALHAVRSPGAAQKLQNQRPACQQSAEGYLPLAIGRAERKIRRA